MTVIARDAVARDHLVYAWPLPIGPECEISCGDDDQVVMCPAWMVGDRLGPGRHLWRTPDPMRPVSAFFVATTPVDVTFDMTTAFMIPATGQPVRIRATGSLQVRCADPALLIAQFVGLPFDAVNEGVLRSVSRSIERMLARLLTRRVVMAATPVAVTDLSMLANIVEELVAYNPTAGAVFGIELLGVSQLVIGADDGSAPFVVLPTQDWQPQATPQPVPVSDAVPEAPPTNGRSSHPEIQTQPLPRPQLASASGEIVSSPPSVASGEINSLKKTQRHASVPPIDAHAASSTPKIEVARDPRDSASTAGEIVVRPKAPVPKPPELPPTGTQPPGPPVEVPRSVDEITQPGVHTPVPGTLKAPTDGVPKARSSSPSIPPPIPSAAVRPTPPPKTTTTLPMPPMPAPASPAAVDDARGSILGIGMSHIGSGSIAGEIPTKIAPGGRVLVPGPNGLMQSATVRQLLQGYYELEVGSSGETIWVPIAGVVPE